MFSKFWRRCNDAYETRYVDEKKPRKPLRFLFVLKSCFDHGSVEVDIPSRSQYQRAHEPAPDYERQEVHGIQAEYLDEDDMAWGKPKKSKKQARRNYESYVR